MTRRELGKLHSWMQGYTLPGILHSLFLGTFCDDRPMELVFSVSREADGGFVAECLPHDILTQAETWGELRANAREAVTAYFFDQATPTAIRLHLVRDELLVVG